ncbi:MAG: hypothetical protein ABEK10_02465 [Candidatus Nanosalina sp.]
MSAEPEVMDYESISDLEDTIEEVYSRVDRLEKEMSILTDEVEGFLNYEHNPDMLQGSAEYVEENIPDEALARLAVRYAVEQLENPEQAENWDKLQEAAEKATGLADTYRDTYETLWNEFGFQGEALNEKIDGRLPVNTFLEDWNENPQRLFRDQETYDTWQEKSRAVPKPTMARYFDIDESEQTARQKDDIARKKQLQKEKETEGEQPSDHITRNQLNQGDRENPFSDARWVDQEMLLLQNTLEGKPAAFRKRKV